MTMGIRPVEMGALILAKSKEDGSAPVEVQRELTHAMKYVEMELISASINATMAIPIMEMVVRQHALLS